MMCSIFGAVGSSVDMNIVDPIKERATDRGRDGGRVVVYGNGVHAVLGNWRATPTTEEDVGRLQPYEGVVHNGIIANDKELGLGEGHIDSEVLPEILDTSSLEAFVESVERIEGSYALAAWTGGDVYVACNYKPIHYWSPDGGENVYFSSVPRHFQDVLPRGQSPVPVPPYTAMSLLTGQTLPISEDASNKAIVVCSGGLDSTVAAAKLVDDGYDVTLLHFLYGTPADKVEAGKIPLIADALGCDYEFLELPYSDYSGDSSLFDRKKVRDEISSEDKAGAELAHEWVPARNLVMTSLAIAYAEAKGYSYVATGINLEESGSHPDNEEHFMTLLDQASRYAVGPHKHMEVLSPVGTLMKHEIVALGESLGAPFEHTYSCYAAGAEHCGECGPCFMRRTAFERNDLQDPVMME